MGFQAIHVLRTTGNISDFLLTSSSETVIFYIQIEKFLLM